MKFRVWNEDVGGPEIGECIDADSEFLAAKNYALTSEYAFPEDHDGDRCNVRVAPWAELPDDDAEWPTGKRYSFKLVITRRVEQE